MLGRGLLLVLLGACALPTVAFAKPPGASKRADAQRHYDAGVVHYKAHEFPEAAAEFQAAYAITATPQWLFNIASAYRLAGEPQKSLDYYKQYLAAVPDAANRQAVEQRMDEVSAQIPPPAPPPAPAPPPTAVEDTTRAELVAPPPKKKPRHVDLDAPSTPYEVGARLRYLFVTSLMLKPYLDASTELNSWSMAAEFIYHKKNYDIVTSLDFSWLKADTGNWRGAGHDPGGDTKYTQFPNVSMLSADVSIIGHHDFNKWFQLRGGAGLGVGVVFGRVLLTESIGCTKTNAKDLTQCHPDVANWDPKNPEPSLKASENGGGNTGIHRHSSKDKPPATGVLNLMMGARFNLPHKFTVDVELGFRDVMFFGLGAHYKF